MGYMARIVQSKYSLIKENKRLKNEIVSRDSSALMLNTLMEENRNLKSALSRSATGDDILGVILSRPPMSPYDTLIIDIGSADGLSVGNKVYTEGDVLVGDIVEVFAHQSKVSLFSSPGRTTSILIGSSTVETLATGRGAGNYVAKLPVEVKIKAGDAIATPQIRMHTFGVVEEIMVDSSDSLQTILFKTPINIHEFKFVEVDRNQSN
jgi:cell shape-determining protein MreC